MNRLLFVVLSAVFSAGCSQTSTIDYGRKPIDAVGIFQCFDRKLVVKVYHGSEGKLNYSIENAKVGVGAATPIINESANWMMFPESTNLVWIHNGANDVTLVELQADGAVKFTSSQIVPDLLRRAPSQFTDRLPSTIDRKTG